MGKSVWKRGLLLFIWGLLFPAMLAAQEPICGFPLVNRTPASVVHLGTLRKPTATTRDFYVRKNVQSTDVEFDTQNFVRYDSSSTTGADVVFFISQDELGRIGDAQIRNFLTDLKYRMFTATPGGAYHPEQGFYTNEIQLFGQPPDIDGNGKVFILLMDIRDNYTPDSGGNYVAGYFDPLDQIPKSNGGSGNNADILYIDTNPGLSENFAQTISTAAHELQHLIHFGDDRQEADWINEGMSEVTAHLFGLPARSFSHFLSNPTRSLPYFPTTDAKDIVDDYAKVGLWTLYLYEQYGDQLLSQIVQDGDHHGLSGLDYIFLNSGLVGKSFDQVFSDWVIANVGVNYLPVGTPEYHYGEFNLPSLDPALLISRFPAVNQQATIKNYSASYVRLLGGEGVSAQVYPPSNLALNGILVFSDGTSFDVVSQENVSGNDLNFARYNDYNNAWLILTNTEPIPNTHSNPDLDTPLSGSYILNLFGAGGRIVQTLDYSSDQTANMFISLGGGTAATVYEPLPPHTNLVSAEVNLYGTEPVTFKLKNSLSGSTIDSAYMASPVQGWNAWALDSLGGEFNSISLLVQTDSNAVGYDSLTAATGNSYFQHVNSTSFRQLQNIPLQDGTYLNGNWDMRLQISYPDTTSVQPGNLTTRYNPWIMSSEKQGSTISLVLLFQEPGNVRADVFNILGQHIRNIYTGDVPVTDQPFTVLWDGTNKYGERVRSGLYFITVRHSDRQEVRKLTLIW